MDYPWKHLPFGLPDGLSQEEFFEGFSFSDNFLRMAFSINSVDTALNDDTIIGGPIGGPISDLTQRQNEVLTLLRENNKITKRDLAKLLDINVSASQTHIEILKDKGYIIRIGGTRGHGILCLIACDFILSNSLSNLKVKTNSINCIVFDAINQYCTFVS